MSRYPEGKDQWKGRRKGKSNGIQMEVENEGGGREQRLLDVYSILITIFLDLSVKSELKFIGFKEAK